MDPLGDLLTTRPIQMWWEFTNNPYQSWQFGFTDNPDRQFGDGLEPLLTLAVYCDIFVF